MLNPNYELVKIARHYPGQGFVDPLPRAADDHLAGLRVNAVSLAALVHFCPETLGNPNKPVDKMN